MPVRTILTWPNKNLRKKSLPAESVEASEISRDLLDTLKTNFGIGIAAPQVGINKRVLLVLSEEIPEFEEDRNLPGAVVFVNPVMTVLDGTKLNSQEACLSVPGMAAVVDRNSRCEISYHNLSGEKQTVKISGRTSCILQHEFDHLDGILFIDRLSAIRKRLVLKKLKKRIASVRPPKSKAKLEAEANARRKKARVARKKRNKARK